ncbi:MAG: hypothetical protein AB8F74_16000, partial [Saprospiraceae bacterium]
MKNKIILKKALNVLMLIWCSITISSAEITLGQITNATTGLCNGSIEITAEGTAAPFTIQLIGPEYHSASNVNGSHTFDYLCPGPYTITVSSEYGCESEFTVFVDGGLRLPYVADIQHPSSCTSENGYIYYLGTFGNRPTPSGGTPPYTWNWSNGLSGTDAFGITDLS